MGFGLVPSFSPLPAFTFEMRRGSCIEKGWEPTRGVTIYVFVPNRHGTGTSGWLQRWAALRKCGVRSVHMANVNACFVLFYWSLTDKSGVKWIWDIFIMIKSWNVSLGANKPV